MTIIETPYNVIIRKGSWWRTFFKPKCPFCGKRMEHAVSNFMVNIGAFPSYKCEPCKTKIIYGNK